jgi:hypothetical protein
MKGSSGIGPNTMSVLIILSRSALCRWRKEQRSVGRKSQSPKEGHYRIIVIQLDHISRLLWLRDFIILIVNMF